MRELVEFLVRALVEQPDKVEVEEFEEDGDLVLEVSVAEDDLGRVIGRGGRIANAIRTVARAAGARDDRRVIVDILDWSSPLPSHPRLERLHFLMQPPTDDRGGTDFAAHGDEISATGAGVGENRLTPARCR